MGDLPLHKNKKFKQGYFYPKNKEKLYGSDRAIYRSGLELKYFQLLDKNENVIQWGAENITVPYFFQDKWHTYYIDLFVIIKEKEKIKKYLIEIKPFKQTQTPIYSKRRKQSNYIKECIEFEKNKAKWKYASDYAKTKDFEFHILSDKILQT